MRAATTACTVGRQRNGIDAALQPVGALLAFEIAAFDQRVDHLLQEERVALGAFDDVAAQQCQRGIGAEMIAQQQAGLRRRQRRHADLPVMRPLHQRRGKTRPEIDHQQRRGADHRISQRLDELLAGRIDPVQILDQDDGGDVARGRARQGADEIEQLRLARLGIELDRRSHRVGQAEKFQQHQLGLLRERKRRQAIEHAAARASATAPWREGRNSRAAIPAPAGTVSPCHAPAPAPRRPGCPCRGSLRRTRSRAGSCRCRPRRRRRPRGHRPGSYVQARARAPAIARWRPISGLSRLPLRNTPLDGACCSPRSLNNSIGAGSPRIARSPSGSTSTNCLAAA